jgi:hypothetical protein
MAQPALHYDRGKLCEALERRGRVDRLATAAFLVEAQAQQLLRMGWHTPGAVWAAVWATVRGSTTVRQRLA